MYSDHKVVGKRRIMKNITIRVAIMSCILLLFAGCGTSDSGTAEAPDAAVASGIEQGDVGNVDNGHITVAQVKAAVWKMRGFWRRMSGLFVFIWIPRTVYPNIMWNLSARMRNMTIRSAL